MIRQTAAIGKFLDRRYFYMKGYHTQSGYMGLVEGSYILFVSEEEYREYIEA